MRFISKTVLLLFVLVMASACSSAFESAGLSADDAALLSSALNVDLVSSSYDFDYTVDMNINAEGETLLVTTAGSGIRDQETGNSLLSMAGEVSGSAAAELGGETLPFDIELRGIGETELYIRGLAPMVDPSADSNAWLFLDVESTSEMAMGSMPMSGGVVSDGEVDVAGLYTALNENLFGSAANYIAATRLDDMDGMAHFQLDVSLGEWLSSEELQTGIEALIPAVAGDAVSEDEIAQAGFALGMGGMLFDSGTYLFDYYVDPASGALDRATVTIAVEIDPAMMGGEGDPVTVDLVLNVDFQEFGADSTITAPEDFIDMTEMMGG